MKKSWILFVGGKDDINSRDMVKFEREITFAILTHTETILLDQFKRNLKAYFIVIKLSRISRTHWDRECIIFF